MLNEGVIAGLLTSRTLSTGLLRPCNRKTRIKKQNLKIGSCNQKKTHMLKIVESITSSKPYDGTKTAQI